MSEAVFRPMFILEQCVAIVAVGKLEAGL